MPKPTHAPGPWIPKWSMRNDDSFTFETRTGNPLFTLKPESVEGAVSLENNARLIAAAPEMADLLRDLTAWYDAFPLIHDIPTDRRFNAARALIARIDGGAA
jgi:hypothetical protein